MPNWHDLATASHDQTAVAVKEALHDGDTANALEGLEELIDALASVHVPSLLGGWDAAVRGVGVAFCKPVTYHGSQFWLSYHRTPRGARVVSGGEDERHAL